MPTDGNTHYYGRTERDGRIVHTIRIDERMFQIVAQTLQIAMQIAHQANLN